MLWVIHILVGVMIALKFKSPWLIIPLAIASHFILDCIPHWDGHFDKKEFKKTGKFKVSQITWTDVSLKTIDIVLSVIVVAFFYVESDRSKIFLGAIMAILPDLAKGAYMTNLKHNDKYNSYLMFHNNIQNEAPMEHGLLIQSCFFVIFIVLLMFII